MPFYILSIRLFNLEKIVNLVFYRIHFSFNLKYFQVACGDGHVVAIGMERMVYSWGENSFGQLGISHTNYQNEPCLVRTLKGKAIVT